MKAEEKEPDGGIMGHFSKTQKAMMVFVGLFFMISLVLRFTDGDPVVLFAVAGLTILPLAYFMGLSTEELAKRMGPGKGGLLNATFGNATELIIAVFALQAGLHEIVKASLTGSIIGNILLVLGLSMFVGGLKHKEQKFGKKAAGTESTMLIIAVVGLTIPTLVGVTMFYGEDVTREVEQLSLWTSGLLIVAYIAGLFFALHTHKDIFNPVGGKEKPEWSQKMAVGVLLLSTLLVSIESEILVGAIEKSSETMGMNELFMGVIVIALIGNAAEHGTAVLMAYKNKMHLSVQIATSSATQVALFVAPFLVLLSWAMGDIMTLNFGLMELVAIGFAVIVVNMVASDGESNWYEGFMLLIVYSIIAVGFWFHPV
jgi:Ca2+:H+ antiporter